MSDLYPHQPVASASGRGGADAPASSWPWSIDVDRTAIVLHFIGAAVALMTLGAIVDRIGFGTGNPILLEWKIVTAFFVAGGISAFCFSRLCGVASDVLSEMETSNQRLSLLLSASGALSAAHDMAGACQSVTHSAITLTHAHAACVFLRPKGDDSLKMTASAGAHGAELYESLIEPLVGLVDRVVSEDRPAIFGPNESGRRDRSSKIQSAAVVPLRSESQTLGALVTIHTDRGRGFSGRDVEALSTLAGLASVAMVNAELKFAQRNFFSHITDLLVTAIDVHLGYHAGHGRRVAHLANRIGRNLGLDDGELERLHFASLLHDIGMLKIERSRTDDATMARKHPVYGHRMLHGIRLWDGIASLVLHHHEWFDGSGYPAGLSGEKIPIGARIIALCEAFDTMTSINSYKSPIAVDEAAKEIIESSGTQFDPTVVDAFMKILTEGTD